MKVVSKADLTATAVAIVVAMQVGFLAMVVMALVEVASATAVVTTGVVAVGMASLDSAAAAVVAMGSAIGDSEEEVVEE